MPTPTPSTISVATRHGVITFTTQLNWDEALSALGKVASEGNDFAQSLYSKAKCKGYMSDSQISWVYKLAQDSLTEKVQPSREESTSIDASNILGVLVEARTNGLKKPLLRLCVPGEQPTSCLQHVRIKYMSVGKNAGGAWVTSNDELVGKISDQGEFTARCNNPEREKFITEFITSVNSYTKAALITYGKITNQCGCCGLPLTNAKSIALGIGPICRQGI